MDTGQRLRALRERAGYSQEEVAKMLGVGRTTYLKYETGENRPTRKLNELARLFNVSTDYLLGNEPPSYYNDPEVAAIAQEMHDNPGIRVLFDASRGLKKESIEEIRKFIEFQRAKEEGL